MKNKVCVAFRGDCQELVKILEENGYSYEDCIESLSKEFNGRVLVITFHYGTYSIVKEFPPLTILDDIFDGRYVPKSIEEFTKVISIENEEEALPYLDKVEHRYDEDLY